MFISTLKFFTGTFKVPPKSQVPLLSGCNLHYSHHPPIYTCTYSTHKHLLGTFLCARHCSRGRRYSRGWDRQGPCFHGADILMAEHRQYREAFRPVGFFSLLIFFYEFLIPEHSFIHSFNLFISKHLLLGQADSICNVCIFIF